MSESLSLVLDPEWAELSALRSKMAAFFDDRDLHHDIGDTLTMVVCELTENALKYGHYEHNAKIDVALTIRPSSVTAEVKNPITDERADNLARLDRMIQWIRGYQDPFEAYLARLEEVSRQSLGSQESGLGLVRIAYEGESILDFYLDDCKILTVCAVYLL